jgi:hypothetical protein
LITFAGLVGAVAFIDHQAAAWERGSTTMAEALGVAVVSWAMAVRLPSVTRRLAGQPKRSPAMPRLALIALAVLWAVVVVVGDVLLWHHRPWLSVVVYAAGLVGTLCLAARWVWLPRPRLDGEEAHR